MRAFLITLLLAGSVLGQHVRGPQGVLMRGDKVQVGKTYRASYMAPEGCDVVTRVLYLSRRDNGRSGPVVKTTLPFTVPTNVYRSVWIWVGYRCPNGATVWVQQTIHQTTP